MQRWWSVFFGVALGVLVLWQPAGAETASVTAEVSVTDQLFPAPGGVAPQPKDRNGGRGAFFERRKPQYLSEFGYMVVPIPYSLPGIGNGWVVIGSVKNFAMDYLDLYGFALNGDAEGQGYGLEELHLLSERLTLDVRGEDISKVAASRYKSRGMNTAQDDFEIMELDLARSFEYTLTATFDDRHYDLYWSVKESKSRLARIRDSEGSVVTEIVDAEVNSSVTNTFGVTGDFTDDRQDPRQGLRLKLFRQSSPPVGSQDPDFYTMNYDFTCYFPVGKISTLALNYFRSDAFVVSKGLVDKVQIASDLGADCISIEDPVERAECEQAVANYVENTWANNSYGTAAALGGEERMRSYVRDRFVGAHSIYYAAEFRWNMREEETPFDIWVMRDMRTGVQLALFYEQGSVADSAADLRADWRRSYGIGARMVTGSGMVYRIDIATGDEGVEQTMMVFYPW